jgi:hypothetical protein
VAPDAKCRSFDSLRSLRMTTIAFIGVSCRSVRVLSAAWVEIVAIEANRRSLTSLGMTSRFITAVIILRGLLCDGELDGCGGVYALAGLGGLGGDASDGLDGRDGLG